MSEVRSFGRFQGVRVKNTVKELIMQKRLSNQNVQVNSIMLCYCSASLCKYYV